MNKLSNNVLFSLAILTIAFSLVFTSCSKDDKDKVKMTAENVLGTWKNVEKDITLVVAEEKVATYTNADYPDGLAMTWYIHNLGWLDVSAGLMVKIFTMESETKLKDDSTGDILTKQ